MPQHNYARNITSVKERRYFLVSRTDSILISYQGKVYAFLRLNINNGIHFKTL